MQNAALPEVAARDAAPEITMDLATEPQPVRRLLQPNAIAIIGISPEAGSHGAAMLSSLESFGYRGAIHLVSRSRREAFGRPCIPSIDELPVAVDLAVLCLPPAGIAAAVIGVSRLELRARSRMRLPIWRGAQGSRCSGRTASATSIMCMVSPCACPCRSRYATPIRVSASSPRAAP
jgi:predicted CoA-binding protein